MRKYVDAEYADEIAKDVFHGQIGVTFYQAFHAIIDSVEHADDVMPVIHAHWEYDKDGMDWGLGAYLCSNCHTRNGNIPADEKINPLAYEGSHYCPQCGAKMDEESVTDA